MEGERSRRVPISDVPFHLRKKNKGAPQSWKRQERESMKAHRYAVLALVLTVIPIIPFLGLLFAVKGFFGAKRSLDAYDLDSVAHSAYQICFILILIHVVLLFALGALLLYSEPAQEFFHGASAPLYTLCSFDDTFTCDEYLITERGDDAVLQLRIDSYGAEQVQLRRVTATGFGGFTSQCTTPEILPKGGVADIECVFEGVEVGNVASLDLEIEYALGNRVYSRNAEGSIRAEIK